MKAIVLYNPAAGRGRGERVTLGIIALLKREGHDAAPLAVSRGAAPGQLREALAATDFLVIAGGDGTVHHALPEVIAARVPLYHLPLGTENLFARQFRTNQDPATLAAAVCRWRILDVDVAWAIVTDSAGPRGRFPFVLMCSVGPDASVIRRLDRARTGPISHLSYIQPIARELVSPWLPRLTIFVDGEKVVDDKAGMVVVANSRQYAMRMDPALNASMTDGLLDVVFFPALSGTRAGLWLLSSRLRRHTRPGGALYLTGREVTVSTLDPNPVYQVDGEAGRATGPGLKIESTIERDALRVLVP